ncbi:DUF4347 domain-containing protein, partial [Thermodesulfobacteriota bacterium]
MGLLNWLLDLWTNGQANGPKMFLQQLEERIVLDASVAPSTDEDGAGDQGLEQNPDAQANAGGDSGDTQGAAASDVAPPPTPDNIDQVFNDEPGQVLISNALGDIQAASPGGEGDDVRVLAISSSISGAEDLAAAAQDGVISIIYDGLTDTPESILSQIESALDGGEASSIAFATHAIGDGMFHLAGGYVVTSNDLLTSPEMQVFWGDLGELLTNDGRIDLLACDLAATELGLQLVSDLESATGHDVAASDDTTGNPTFGGDWVLETDDVDLVATYFTSSGIGDFEGDLANAVTKLSVPGLDNNDEAGWDVDINGSWIAVGVPGDQGLGSFQVYTLNGPNWQWDHSNWTHSDLIQQGDKFGHSVGVSPDGGVRVGAPYNDHSGTDAGLARYYNPTGGANSTYSTGDEQLDMLGFAVDRGIYSSLLADVEGVSDAGKAIGLGGWTTLTSDDPQTLDQFGYSVATHVLTSWEAYHIVGAPGDDHSGKTNAGSAFIFYNKVEVIDGGLVVTNERTRVTAPQPVNDSQFGYAVDISGDWAIVSEPHFAPDDVGSVHFFQRSGSSWVYRDTVSSDANSDLFGESVEIDGDVAIVGSIGDAFNGVGNSGSVTLLQREGTSWQEVSKVGAPDPDHYDYFGNAVAVSGGWAVVGAPGEDGSGTDRGAVYTIDLNSAPTLANGNPYLTAISEDQIGGNPGTLVSDLLARSGAITDADTGAIVSRFLHGRSRA